MLRCVLLACAGSALVVGPARADFLGVAWGSVSVPGSVVHIDAATGALSVRAQLPDGQPNAMARDALGRYYVTSFATGRNARLYRFNAFNDSLHLVAELDVDDVRSMAFLGDELYVYTNSLAFSNQLRTVNLGTGSTELVNAASLGGLQGMAARGGTLYAWSGSNGLQTVNPADAVVTDIDGVFGADPALQGLGFTPDGRLYGAGIVNAGPAQILQIDPATGAFIGGPLLVSLPPGSTAQQNLRDLRGIEWIPTPATGAVLGVGALAFARRRRA